MATFLEYLAGGFVLFICISGWVSWREDRRQTIIERWARENHLEVLETKWRLFGGPFSWMIYRNQDRYLVRVRDAEGNVRSGWLRFLFENDPQVKWNL
jgi:hypothetical protein